MTISPWISRPNGEWTVTAKNHVDDVGKHHPRTWGREVKNEVAARQRAELLIKSSQAVVIGCSWEGVKYILTKKGWRKLGTRRVKTAV